MEDFTFTLPYVFAPGKVEDKVLFIPLLNADSERIKKYKWNPEIHFGLLTSRTNNRGNFNTSFEP